MPLTNPQITWFATLRANLEQETGRSLDAWVAIARTCPETAHRKRLTWFKEQHGLGQNRASVILHAAFPPDPARRSEAAIADALWANPEARAIHAAIAVLATALPGTIVGQRNTFTAYSRRFQFAAAKPQKSAALVGLAIPPAPPFQPAGTDGWSERLLSKILIRTPEEARALLPGALRTAWENA